MQAHLLSLNDFKQPKVMQGVDAAYMNLIYLILLKKGKYQSHPNMGVGIRERFRHSNDANVLSDLQQDIKYQVESFLPELASVSVELSLKNNILDIIIDTSTRNFALQYDTDKETINVYGSELSLQDL